MWWRHRKKPSIDKVQNLRNERRYIHKDPRQDSGQRNISYTRYPKKCFTQTYRDLYGGAMLVLTWMSSNHECFSLEPPDQIKARGLIKQPRVLGWNSWPKPLGLLTHANGTVRVSPFAMNHPVYYSFAILTESWRTVLLSGRKTVLLFR